MPSSKAYLDQYGSQAGEAHVRRSDGNNFMDRQFTGNTALGHRGGRFYERRMPNRFKGQRAVYAIDGSTVEPKSHYAVTGSYAETTAGIGIITNSCVSSSTTRLLKKRATG